MTDRPERQQLEEYLKSEKAGSVKIKALARVDYAATGNPRSPNRRKQR